jgi:hypothetical protein
MRAYRLLFMLLCLAVAQIVTVAQADTPKPGGQLDKMKDLGFLVGTWTGKGWREYTPGQRSDFLHTETVHSKLGGYVLQIEGQGRNAIAGTNETVVTYEGMGIVSFDARRQRYRYSAYEFSGRAGEADDVNLKDGTFMWAFSNVPNTGSLRFRVTLNNEGDWYEYGELSAEGKNWRRYFEMTLHKSAQ